MSLGFGSKKISCFTITIHHLQYCVSLNKFNLQNQEQSDCQNGIICIIIISDHVISHSIVQCCSLFFDSFHFFWLYNLWTLHAYKYHLIPSLFQFIMQVCLSLFICDFAKYINFILGLQFGITPSIYIIFLKKYIYFIILDYVIHIRQRKTKLKLVENFQIENKNQFNKTNTNSTNRFAILKS